MRFEASKSSTDAARPLARLSLAFLALLLPSLVTTAHAVTGPWTSGETVRVRLLSATDAAGTGGEVRAGLQVSLNDGWDTYWRSPGDAGAPPTVDWSGSTNLASVEWRWPAPTRFTLFGLETFGYLHEVVFPLTVHPKRPGERVALRGQADLLVCSDVCVPKHLTVSLDLPTGAATSDAEASNLIARYEAQVPDDGSGSGLAVQDIAARLGTPAALEVRIASRQPLAKPDVIVESGKWSFGKPAFSFGPDGRTATAVLPVTSGPDTVGLPDSPVTVTLLDGLLASETHGRIAAGTALVGGNWTLDILPFRGAAPAAAGHWAVFDEAAARRLVAQGKTVFVDVTAEWCVNCKVNEALVLGQPDVGAALRAPDVVAMRADWTRPDPRISDYLARNDRFGIPFNAVYGPGAPRGIVLPEILTQDAVLGALHRASGTAKISAK
ncbi:protein-disulfide reductase DsbD family protein [Roseomonas sp. E05]|nr:protein-disulfide reductase DsbD domain-containing protein [Roseomonas sp. E05]MDJ0390309.1 protein-disulfide reductase DsbD family protein [Roseomonas sp. E05]